MASAILPPPPMLVSSHTINMDDLIETDPIHSLVDLDDLFTDVMASLEKEQETISSTATIDIPNPLSTPIQAKPLYVPVSPSSSCIGLDEILEVEPTTLAEMRASSSASSVGRVSPQLIAPSQKRKETATPDLSLSNPKKRMRSANSSVALNIEDEDIQQARRERNREHAKRSRQRKKSLTGDLQQSLKELKDENKKLRDYIYAAIGQRNANPMINKRIQAPTDNFVQTLQKPENRVMDAATLKFLAGLRKKLPARTSA